MLRKKKLVDKDDRKTEKEKERKIETKKKTRESELKRSEKKIGNRDISCTVSSFMSK